MGGFACSSARPAWTRPRRPWQTVGGLIQKEQPHKRPSGLVRVPRPKEKGSAKGQGTGAARASKEPKWIAGWKEPWKAPAWAGKSYASLFKAQDEKVKAEQDGEEWEE